MEILFWNEIKHKSSVVFPLATRRAQSHACTAILVPKGLAVCSCFTYVNVTRVTCVTFTHEHLCLHPLMHHMRKFWCANGVNGAIFHIKIYTPQRGTGTVAIYNDPGSKPIHHLLFICSHVCPKLAFPAVSFFIELINPKTFSFIFHRFWEICAPNSLSFNILI